MPYQTPDHLLYTEDHEWLRRDDDSDEALIGITDFAQQQVGDVVYLELPPNGTQLQAGQPFAEIESAKTVAELIAPVSGELIASNPALEQRPELVNESPYDEGWIARVRIADLAQLERLLPANAYRAQLPQD